MLLSVLLDAAGIAAEGAPRLDVAGIAYDSRRILPGGLFVAVPGFHVDGAQYVANALARGAVAAIVNFAALPSVPAELADRCLGVPDTRLALAALAAEFYGHPSRSLRTIGVTGTDGKTTTCFMIAAVLESGGLAPGLFSTVAFRFGDGWQDNDSRQTTPEALEVQQMLRRMVDTGCRSAVLESSSHGLELLKLDGCNFDAAVFTNLSPDHLDFHGSLVAYRAAKGRLFGMLDAAVSKGVEKRAIVNADDPEHSYMASRTRASCLRYGLSAEADVVASDLQTTAGGTEFRVRYESASAAVRLAIPGRFNVSNALAAIATGISQGVPLARCAAALTAWTGVPGRLQSVDAGQPFSVIVDYAHTGAALTKVLQTLRPLVLGRLIVVFGCAGERGHERRTGMGEAAALLADYSVITSEDPRGEQPDSIIADIAAAMTTAGAREGQKFERVTDRREAIARALALAEAGDVVLLAGKGHEHSIETASGAVPWDEASVARSLLQSSVPSKEGSG